MADMWHYTRDGKSMDPVSTPELKHLAQAGLLKPTDLVWHEGMPAWAPASKTRGLFGDAPSLHMVPEPITQRDAPEAPDDLPRRAGRARSPEPRVRNDDDGVDSGHSDDRPPRRRPSSDGLSTGAVIGVVVGAVVLIVAVVIGSMLLISSANPRRGPVAQNNPQFGNPQILKDKDWQPWQPPPDFNRPQEVGLQRPNPPPVGGMLRIPKDGLTINGQLTNADPLDPVLPHAPRCKVYLVNLNANERYTIDLVSTEFDAYLRVENEKFFNLAEDDDSGGDLNAQIMFVPTQTGLYRIIATCFDEGIGRFTLTVRAGK
ncbi:MAG: DUF4339 domain-containing protein [Planctomycetes bacterium]|nr:DUF4339 domain-containing protein [Planctomycetota bacterium]